MSVLEPAQEQGKKYQERIRDSPWKWPYQEGSDIQKRRWTSWRHRVRTPAEEILDRKKLRVKRGEIYDRNGLILATNDELESVYAYPKEIKSIEEVSEKLSKILNLSKNELINKFKKKRNFVWIKRQISPKQAELIKSLKIPGINFEKEYKRFYPNRDLGSHIIGFCNIDSVGVEGIEKSMDSYLIPEDLYYKKKKSYRMGSNVILTIDANIQAIGDTIIKKNIINENADSGSLILLDGKTGEILSMSNYPNFDPNNYKKYDQKVFRNISVFNQFEPGSVLKIFTTASLLDNNKLSLNDFFGRA